jgi:hypothetical protein
LSDEREREQTHGVPSMCYGKRKVLLTSDLVASSGTHSRAARGGIGDEWGREAARGRGGGGM